MHSSLITGSMPGMAASTSDTCEFGSPPNAVEAPENSFDCEVTWAWTSSPITTSQPPVAPLISLDFIWGAFIDLPRRRRLLDAFSGALWLDLRTIRHKLRMHHQRQRSAKFEG